MMSRVQLLIIGVGTLWALNLAPTSIGLALEWAARPGYRLAPLTVAASTGPGFTLLSTAQTGVRFTNTLTQAPAVQFQNLMNGSGVCAGDVDGDGNVDLYFCNRQGANGLFLNLGGGVFTNATVLETTACTNQTSSACLFADVDGDGDLDLVVDSFEGPNVLLLNDGSGRFTSTGKASGLTTQQGATSMAMGDLDGDGDLDLYMCHFGTISILRDGAAVSVRTVNGQPAVTGRFANRLKIVDGMMHEMGEPDAVFMNVGGGRFERAAWKDLFLDEQGKPSPVLWDFGLAVQIRDMNADGLPDIYVCNDFQTPDRMWLNQGGGKFRAIEQTALRNMSYASMGVDFADINRDGFDDFITVEMLSRDHSRYLRQTSARSNSRRIPGKWLDREETMRNNLFMSRGDGTFMEVALMAGVAASDWSWTPIFLDVDLDGYEDLLISNGHLHDVNDRDVAESVPPQAGQVIPQTKSTLNRYPPLNPAKYAFRNRGDGTFEDVGSAWHFDSPQMGHGMALSDIDNDGDLDVIMNALNGEPLIFRNDSQAPRIAVRLKGCSPNTRGIGARIVVSGGPVTQSQEMICGGHYLSGDDPIRAFAAWNVTNRFTLEVRWPGGQTSTIREAAPNFVYEIEEPQKSAVPITRAPTTAVASNPPATPWFIDVSDQLKHRHVEEAFDDFSIQPLLPWKQSQTGPGVGWVDMTGDGRDELVIGTGRGGALAVFENQADGTFRQMPSEGLAVKAAEDDITGLAAWSSATNSARVLAGQARYESPHDNGELYLFSSNNGSPLTARRTRLGTAAMGSGSVVLADIDGSGVPRAFVAGGVVPGRYPEHYPNRVLKLSPAGVTLDEPTTLALTSANLVRGALWTDLNADGFPELLLAEEWGPIRIFLNHAGRLEEATSQFGLNEKHGLWTGLAAGDFDGDGKIDFVAGNWGLNTMYQSWPATGHDLFHGDLADIDSIQIIEGVRFQEAGPSSPWRSLAIVSAGFPGFREAAGAMSHLAYSKTNLAALLDPWKSKLKHAGVNCFESTVFLNRGDRFESHPLPFEAQVAPIFGVAVADADLDGVDDLFLAQNFFAVRPEETRLDGGRGLWLKGMFAGNFTSVSGQESGVKIYGETRGCAVGDFDGDGRVDLVVAQNGAETRLFKNQTTKAGLRVRLRGPEHNTAGYGAVLRIGKNGVWGPAREIHAGSGWLSQDSATQIFRQPPPGSRIEVRWPGGHVTDLAIPEGKGEMTVSW